MKPNFKTIVPAVLMMSVLAACGSFGKKDKPALAQPAAQASAPQGQSGQIREPQTVRVDSIDGRKEVAYRCGDKGQQPISVMYGFKGNEVVAAQVKIGNHISPGLFRVVGNNDSNMFTGQGVTWVADKATAQNVDKVNGNMLTQETIQTVNGKPEQVSQILVKYCALDKGKAAAKPAAKTAKGKKAAKAK